MRFAHKQIPVIAVAALLLIVLLSTGVPVDLLRAIQVIAICIGFIVVSRYIQACGHNSPVRPWLWLLLLGSFIVLAGIILNQIIAIFVTGCLFLVTHFILGFPGASVSPPGRRALIPLIISVSIALLATPPTVSRVVIGLENLAVPSKFQLHSDPGARLKHHASRSYAGHSFDPIEVNLSANNIVLDDAMPWIQIQSRRETRFVINWISYQFLHAPIKVLGPNDLRQLELAERSDPVLLAATEGGIKIEEISAGESAWIKLPQPDKARSGLEIRIVTALVKLLVWLLISTAFFMWAPVTRK
jgi:hypothetical protein